MENYDGLLIDCQYNSGGVSRKRKEAVRFLRKARNTPGLIRFQCFTIYELLFPRIRNEYFRLPPEIGSVILAIP